jgi:ABC-type phosphate/phosphonate transport system substrate-binding protein
MVSHTTRGRLRFTKNCTVKWAKRAAGLAIWLAALCIPAVLAAQIGASRQDAPAQVRIALSTRSFAGLNRNDALASMTTWAKVISKQRGIAAEVETSITDRPEELAEALRSGQTDAAAMPTDEFLRLKAKPEFVLLSTKKNSFTERYVILVHRNSGIAVVGDLRGRKLLLHNSPRTSLASAWFAALLGLPKTESAGMTRVDNASRTILPVFFRQADACVVTSSVFEIASELNPQLRKDLRVLESSPEVVPVVFFFRPGYSSAVKDELEAALVSLNETPAGRQVLTIFQADGLVKQPVSCLESSRQLRDEGGRLTPRGSN